MTRGREVARPKVLYLVYWGALEPLGRSLVAPSVLRLAELGVDVTLITFEKPADLRDSADVCRSRSAFEAAGVRWLPLRYHKSPKWPATAFDSLIALVTALRLRMRWRFDVVHARTFVAGPAGYLIARLLGARFVYHNEGFYPDEQVDGGVWRQGSMVHRLARQIEAFLYDRADGLMVLSERARDIVRQRPKVRAAGTPVIVVPSAVNLEVFRPAKPAAAPPKPLSLVYLGSVGLRYRLDEAGRFVAAVREVEPLATLTVVSHADRQLIEFMLDSAGLPREAWDLRTLTHPEIPGELRRHDAGLFFLTEGLSEFGCSPTKIGEYWACGLPVVTTPNVSDTDALVRATRVGIVVNARAEGSYASAARDLVHLLQDPDLSGRCRRAAEASYSLEAACLQQKLLYVELVS